MEDVYRREVIPHGTSNVQPYPWLEVTSLPRLPIPTIGESAKRYVEFLEALVAGDVSDFTAVDLARSKRFVADFVAHDAPALQADLEQMSRASPTSWLEGWWDTGYLEFRVPSFINVNPFFIFKTDPARPTPVRTPFPQFISFIFICQFFFSFYLFLLLWILSMHLFV